MTKSKKEIRESESLSYDIRVVMVDGLAVFCENLRGWGVYYKATHGAGDSGKVEFSISPNDLPGFIKSKKPTPDMIWGDVCELLGPDVSRQSSVTIDSRQTVVFKRTEEYADGRVYPGDNPAMFVQSCERMAGDWVFQNTVRLERMLELTGTILVEEFECTFDSRWNDDEDRGNTYVHGTLIERTLYDGAKYFTLLVPDFNSHYDEYDSRRHEVCSIVSSREILRSEPLAKRLGVLGVMHDAYYDACARLKAMK